MELDFNQGRIFFKGLGVYRFPVLVFSRGGAKTLLLVPRSGGATIRIRRFTSRESWFRVADNSGNVVIARGTEYSVQAQPDGTFVAGVQSGAVEASSGESVKRLGSGQGATMKDGEVAVFEVDYVLALSDRKVTRNIKGRNVISGCVGEGNSVFVDEAIVPLQDGCFETEVSAPIVTIQNAAGVKRTFVFDGIRPFRGH